jgi:hypothetical protein
MNSENEKNCLNCGETITRTYESKGRWENRKYCDASCQMKHEYSEGERDKDETVKEAQKARKKQGLERFEEDPTTKVSKRGYKLIYIPSYLADKHEQLEPGWMKMHHYVWWKENGELPPVDDINDEPTGKVMHHKDGDKLNNDIENLEILSNDDHTSLHQSS